MAVSRSTLMAPIAAARGGQRARKGGVPPTEKPPGVLVQVGVEGKPGEWGGSGGRGSLLVLPR